jgi:predicted 3-demethylubiquinone-9 3-methyltransferase (glyoxalase superfamily)
MPKITPFLWFDTQAEEAANFYVSIFDASRFCNSVSQSTSESRNSAACLTKDS